MPDGLTENEEWELEDLTRKMRRHGLTDAELARRAELDAAYWAERNAAGYWKGQ